MAKPIPDGFAALTPHLIVRDADRAVEFYKRAFGAEEVACMRDPQTRRLVHAELDALGGRFMLCQARSEMNCLGPDHYRGTPVSMYWYVEDCDRSFWRAVVAGAEIANPLEDMFWGDRFGKVRDPFGHEWAFATHQKDLTSEELERAGEEWTAGFKREAVTV